MLLCDDDREATSTLSLELRRFGHWVTTTRSCAEAFAAACAEDFDALLFAPFVRDGSALVLPAALGIRRPPLVVLVCLMTERLAQGVAAHFGVDAQATKVASVRRLDRLVRTSMAHSVAASQRPAEPTDASPPSGIGARFPQ